MYWFATLLITSMHLLFAGDVTVPAGQFKPVFTDKGEDQVSVRKLKVNKTPVTNAEFLEFVKAHPNWAKSNVKSIFADESYLKNWVGDFSFQKNLASTPVVFVSWFAARAYCKSRGQRLPSIHEWEYFSDAGSTDTEKATLTWLSKGPQPLRPVTALKSNKFGLLGTIGSVWEWTEDFSSAIMSEDSRGDTKRDFFCGGAALGSKDPQRYAAFMRYAFRSSLTARYTASSLGFRCVETFSTESE